MTQEEFNAKWDGRDVDQMEDDELRRFKDDSFALYESTGFTEKFDSPYDDQKEHKGMPFKVLRRATTKEVDLETMPVWLIEFENGDQAYCYPEEIAVLEQKK